MELAERQAPKKQVSVLTRVLTRVRAQPQAREGAMLASGEVLEQRDRSC